MPIAISVNMLRLRVSTDCQPRTKNGQPAHSTTGVAKRELDPVRERADRRSRGRRRCARPSRARPPGRVSARPIQNRRVMSASSGLGPVSAVAHLGLERHAADRAGAGADLADLRMHRAGVDRAFRHRRRGAFVRACPDIWRDRRRTWCGSRPSRNNRRGRDARGGAWRCADRPSCRRPDRTTRILRRTSACRGDCARDGHARRIRRLLETYTP